MAKTVSGKTRHVLCDEQNSIITRATVWQRIDGEWLIHGLRDEDRLITAAMALQGESIWVGYDAGGWSWPDDVELYVAVELHWRNRHNTWLYVYVSRTTPDVHYVQVFKDMRRFADANGDHMGEHPCGGYAVPVEMIERVYAETSMR